MTFFHHNTTNTDTSTAVLISFKPFIQSRKNYLPSALTELSATPFNERVTDRTPAAPDRIFLLRLPRLIT